MSNGAAAGGAAGAAAAAAAAVANAIKASGAIVKVEAPEFRKILDRAENPLVAYAEGGFWGKNYQYLVQYRGLYFFCKTGEPIHLPSTVQTVICEKIWIPG